MSEPTHKSWLPLLIILTAVAAWGIFLAVGVYLEIGADHPRHDLRKALIVLATVGGFLVFWGVALAVRSRRQGRESRGVSDPDTPSDE